MINNLTIKNHKTHRDTRLDFCDGVNIIIGDPQSGKSNILKSMKLLFSNRPVGFKYQSKFSDDPVEISAGMDGKKITFWKDEDSAEYKIDKKSFKGFGTNVPDEIKSFLNVSELNIQKQFDKPFLLFDSAGEVAKTMNRIIKTEELDKWQAGLTKKINRTKGDIDRIKNELKKDKENLKKYDNIEQVERIVQRVKKREELIENKEDDLMNIEACIRDLDGINSFLDIAYERLKAEELIRKAELINEEINAVLGERYIILEFLDLHERCFTLTKQKKELSKVILKSEKYFESIDDIDEEIDSREEELEVIEKWLRVYKDVSYLNEQKDEVLEEYKGLLKKFGKCPICNSKIDQKKIKEIVDRI